MMRMGARASVAPDQRPLGHSRALVVRIDEAGNETASEELHLEQHVVVLRVEQFVDLADGRRITTGAQGQMSLSLARECTLHELHDDLREFIFEDEMREVVDEMEETPRWEHIAALLAQSGVVADEHALSVLPFVLEVDPEVVALLDT